MTMKLAVMLFGASVVLGATGSSAQEPPSPPPVFAAEFPPLDISAPETMNYRNGDPVPFGYHVESKVRTRVVVGGAVTLGGAFAITAIGAVMAITMQSGESDSNPPLRGNLGQNFKPLFVPVLGPFIAIGTTQPNGAGTALLIADGVVQVGGFAMLLAGLGLRKKELVRNDSGALDLAVTPIASPGLAGVGIVGAF